MVFDTAGILAVLVALLICGELQAQKSSLLTLCCGDDGKSCCGQGWQLHCCEFQQNRCCLGDKFIAVRGHRRHKHDWNDWEWDDDDWLPVTLVVILCVVAISCVLLCCCRHRRSGSLRHEFRLLPKLKYGAIPPNVEFSKGPMHQKPATTENQKMFPPSNVPPPPYSETTWA